MKKTVTVNLGGYVFHIDEDACIRLETYLAKIESGIANKEEAKEVMHDIELRLSELLKERLGGLREVINMDDVNHVVKIMGEPEDINDNAKEDASSSRSFGKRMYRDPDNRILGGVGAGLGAYFGIDPVVIRILLVLTFFAFGPLLYIILWIAMPEAKNAAQKLEMRGETVNAENIKKNIKDEYEKVKTSINNKKTRRDIEEIFREIFNVLGRVIMVFVKATIWVIGIALIIGGVVLLFSFTDIFMLDGWQTGLDGLSDFLHMVISPVVFNLIIISLFIIVGIPVVAILLGLIRMVTGMKKNKYVSSGMGITWFCGVIMIIILSATQARNYKIQGSETDIIKLDSIKTKHVVIKTTIPDINENEWSSGEGRYLWSINKNEEFEGIYSMTELYIYPGEDSVPVVRTERLARGKNRALANKNIDTTITLINVKDSVLDVMPGFIIKKDSPFRFQKTKVKIYLPIGYRLDLTPETEQILIRADNTSYLEYYEMAGKSWVMTEKGLKLAE